MSTIISENKYMTKLVLEKKWEKLIDECKKGKRMNCKSLIDFVKKMKQPYCLQEMSKMQKKAFLYVLETHQKEQRIIFTIKSMARKNNPYSECDKAMQIFFELYYIANQLLTT